MKYEFRQASREDIEAVFTLYKARVRWMDQKGIQQWNVTDYLNTYPKAYYEEQQAQGTLYVLINRAVVGAVVLLTEDARWPKQADSPAFYVHNLVTDPTVREIGGTLLAEVEKLAVHLGKRFVRLDCAVDNEFLNCYYESHGYRLAGTCVDGLYVGNKREKNL